jgi:hypothetical protein
MAFDYIFQGPPTSPVSLQPALALDEVDNVLYISSVANNAWVQIGNSSSANDSVQNLTTSQPITFLGATNTFVKATAGAGGITLTFPSAIGLSGRKITVIMIDQGAGGVTLATTLSQTINGSFSSYELTNQYQSVTFESDNANWFVVSTAN